MQNKTPAFFISVLCLLLVLPFPACSRKPTLEQEAEKFAQEYWETFFTKCPDSYVMKRYTWYKHGSIGNQGEVPLRYRQPNQPSQTKPLPEPTIADQIRQEQKFGPNPFPDYDDRDSPEAIYQYHFVTMRIEKEPVVEFVEKLIDTEFKGTCYFEFQSWRFYSPAKQTWSYWAPNTDLKFKARIFKHEGKWEIYGVNGEIIGRNKLKTVFKNVEPIDCGNLPQS